MYTTQITYVVRVCVLSSTGIDLDVFSTVRFSAPSAKNKNSENNNKKKKSKKE